MQVFLSRVASQRSASLPSFPGIITGGKLSTFGRFVVTASRGLESRGSVESKSLEKVLRINNFIRQDQTETISLTAKRTVEL